MRGQSEARLKELEHARDLQKAAEGKLQKCQESLLACQKSCVDKSKAIRELQAQVLGGKYSFFHKTSKRVCEEGWETQWFASWDSYF